MNKLYSHPSIKRLLNEIAEVATYLWQRGWAEKNAGNISVHISDLLETTEIIKSNSPFFQLPEKYPELSGKLFIVSGTGKRMRDTARHPQENVLIILINNSGTAYQIVSTNHHSNTIAPTSELPTHMSIHQMIAQRGTKEKVIIHTHANELIALTQIREYCNEEKLNKLLWGMHPESMLFIPEGVGFVPYVTPGTLDIAKHSIPALQEHPIAIWEKHGVFAIGEDINDTFDLIDILTKSAKIFFMLNSTNNTPEGLSNKDLEKLKSIAARINKK